MTINSLSVGKDVVITITDANGPVTIPRIKSFNSKQKTSNRETVALDGINRHVNIPQGWEGDFELERNNYLLDNYIANLEANYYAGKNLPTLTITETINEYDGSVTQWQYVGVAITYDAGTWKGDDYVTLKISFSAQQRNKIA